MTTIYSEWKGLEKILELCFDKCIGQKIIVISFARERC